VSKGKDTIDSLNKKIREPAPARDFGLTLPRPSDLQKNCPGVVWRRIRKDVRYQHIKDVAIGNNGSLYSSTQANLQRHCRNWITTGPPPSLSDVGNQRTTPVSMPKAEPSPACRVRGIYQPNTIQRGIYCQPNKNPAGKD
jgi:hypothetical protein